MTVKYITDPQVLENIKTYHDYFERINYINPIESSTNGTIIGLYIDREINTYNIILQYADTLELLICESCNLTEIPKIEHLTHLICSNNQITELGDYQHLTILNCDNNKITKLGIYPNLTKLYCGLNKITELGVYPNLTTLFCYNNQITKLGDYQHLTRLYCYNNQITELGVYPNLTKFVCYWNQITELGDYQHLTTLDCGINKITNLGDYPNLTTLVCCNNQITELGVYPNLIELNCYSNQITELGDYPNLTTLHCYYNQITELGDYPNLTYLNCYNNRITKLGDYPNLTELECYNNPLNPIYITRLNRIMLRNENKKNIYNDGQNVHDHTIQESLKKSIKYLMDNYGGKKIVFEIPEELDGINYHSELMLTEKEIFELVLKRINEFDDETKKELEKILYDELENGRCKCFTGRVTRIVNTLVGFDENITIGISDNEQIMNIYDVLLKQGKLSKETFREALTEREYDEDIIVTWVDAIDE